MTDTPTYSDLNSRALGLIRVLPRVGTERACAALGAMLDEGYSISGVLPVETFLLGWTTINAVRRANAECVA